MFVILGWCLDRLFGDPARLPHPIVLFGKSISVMEKLLNRGKFRILKGALCAVSLIVAAYAATDIIIRLANSVSAVAGQCVCVIGVFFALSGKTLAKEVKMVFEAVEVSLEKGRKQVARIVGRDTSNLSASEIRTAALETLAENLSDGVIAPLFWCAIAGVPGMFAYKMVNTLDSMIGYKNERYILFGRVAAITDDLANYIPSRITAFIMLLVAPLALCVNRNEKRDCGNHKNCSFIERIKFVAKYGKEHLSPNSGYPEAALASILDCRFGGPHNYFGKEVYKPYIGTNHKDFTMHDMYVAVSVNLYSEVVMVVVVSVVMAML